MFIFGRFFPVKKELGRNVTEVKICFIEKYVSKNIGEAGQTVFCSNKQKGLHLIFYLMIFNQ